MSEYMHLVGAEDVQRAGYAMSAAAKTMADALAWHADALARHQQFLDEWLARLEALLDADAGRRK